jgi:peptidoglycan hydrolase CwlO-like protein
MQRKIIAPVILVIMLIGILISVNIFNRNIKEVISTEETLTRLIKEQKSIMNRYRVIDDSIDILTE